jgi:hypothetical protein
MSWDSTLGAMSINTWNKADVFQYLRALFIQYETEDNDFPGQTGPSFLAWNQIT